jgi:hypothetical protein
MHTSLRRVFSADSACWVAVLLLAGATPVRSQGIQFQPEVTAQPPGFGAVAVDLDGDGDLDLFGRSVQGFYDPAVARNDGRGAFGPYTALTIPGLPAFFWLQGSVLAVGDIDGDGDHDIVFARPEPAPTQSTVFTLRNDGSGAFTLGATFTVPYVLAMALGDLDGDGDLDLVTSGTYGSSIRWNNGSGGFTAGPLLGSSPVGAVQLRDVDGDGDLDLVEGRGSIFFPSGGGTPMPMPLPNLVRRNNGVGGFASPTSFGNSVTVTLDLADLDGDGDLDVLETDGAVFVTYANDGLGNFVPWQAWPYSFSGVVAVQLTDVELDGDVDVVLFRTFGPGFEPYLNQGGAFATAPDLSRVGVWGIGTSPQAYHPVFGDFDDDGDLDVLCAGFDNGAYQSVLFRNLRRDLRQPAGTQIGQLLTLDASARFGPTTLAVAFLSPSPASIPFPPFGRIGIDPGQLIPLPWLVLTAGAGSGTVSLLVPNDQSLVGQDTHGQAFLIDGNDHLTNVTRGTILP